MSIDSPCINVCVLDENQVCEGCKRTLAEIQEWPMLTDFDKRLIIESIEEGE